MSQCTDVDKALADLENKIDTQNKKIDTQDKEIARLRQLQQQCCGKHGIGNNSDLERRVSRLESYCNSIEKLFKEIKETIQPIVAIFKG
jgi:predicted  nucleic acid-binding Zn-ribbon protein